MNTPSTASVPTFCELVAALPVVIFVRAVREALGSGERRFVVGQAARA